MKPDKVLNPNSTTTKVLNAVASLPGYCNNHLLCMLIGTFSMFDLQLVCLMHISFNSIGLKDYEQRRNILITSA